MSKAKRYLKIIGSLERASSGSWVFSSKISGEAVSVRISHLTSELAINVDFTNKLDFSDWFEDVASEQNIEAQNVSADEIVSYFKMCG